DWLKYEIRNTVESRHPQGGRPPRRMKAKRAYSVELRELLALNQKWLNLHDSVLTGESGSVIDQLQSLHPAHRKRVVDLVSSVKDSLSEVAEAALKFKHALARLPK